LFAVVPFYFSACFGLLDTWNGSIQKRGIAKAKRG